MRDDELRAALRAEAESHSPDREAMLGRITRTAMSPGAAAPRRGPRVRVAAAAAAVVAVLAGGGIANWGLAGDPEPDGTAPAPAPAPSTSAPSPAAPSPAAPSPAAPTSRAATPPTRKPASNPPRTPGKKEAPLRSNGEAEPGAGVVTLTTTERLTALEVVIRVARTDGLTARDGTKRTPGASVTATVAEEPDTLLYRFVMSPADVLEPGTYTFTARYRHPSGDRDAARDTYSVTATPAGDTALTVTGGFPRITSR